MVVEWDSEGPVRDAAVILRGACARSGRRALERAGRLRYIRRIITLKWPAAPFVAQAVGVPVIATKVGGVAEIVEDGVDGLLVFPKDDEAIADRMRKVIDDPGLAENLVSAARHKVEEKFSLSKMAQDTISVYREALEVERLLVIKFSLLNNAAIDADQQKIHDQGKCIQ